MNKKIEITRRLEFDAGHRIPHHDGHCKHVHGHRYVLEVTLMGNVLSHQGHGDDGMVLDFGDIKKITNEEINPSQENRRSVETITKSNRLRTIRVRAKH